MLQIPFCLVHIAGSQLEMSFVQSPSWCLPNKLICFPFILLCLRINDVSPFAANKSCAWWVARTMKPTRGSSSSSSSSFGTTSKGRSMSASSAFCLIVGVLEVGLSRVVLRLAVGVVGSSSATSSTFAACEAVEHLGDVLFVCMIILLVCRCVVWSVFFIPSVIVHVREARRSGVTVASNKHVVQLFTFLSVTTITHT